MPWPKTGASHEHAQLELLHKVRAIKDLAVTMVFGQNRRDLAPLSYPWLLDLTLECHGQQPRPYGVINNILKDLHSLISYTKQCDFISAI